MVTHAWRQALGEEAGSSRLQSGEDVTRLIRKYYKKFVKVDVLILSPIYGMISADEKIVYKEPIGRDWRRLSLNEDDVLKIQKSTYSVLKKFLEKNHYDEVYVNVGKNMLKHLIDFEKTFPHTTKITYSKGRGIGPKMTDMKRWIETNAK